jgi:hypothetical protein
LNEDIDGDGVCDLNCDTNNDGKPESNIDLNGDGTCDINCDPNHDGICDYNCDTTGNYICNINCDTNGDKKPDMNIDITGNGKCDVNCDTDGDGKPDKNLTNIDTNNDGKCDLNCDTDGDGWPDKSIDLDGDGICDMYCPTTSTMDTINVGSGAEVYSVNLTELSALSDSGIMPGWSGYQSFTIKSNYKSTVYFDLAWKDVTNNFTEENNLDYTVKRNGNVISSGKAPYSDGVFLSNQAITTNTSDVYVITYTFKETGQNQDVDKAKTFSTHVQVITK